MTSGKEIAIQATVTLEAVCAHNAGTALSSFSASIAPFAFSVELKSARFVRIFADDDGDDSKSCDAGAGDAVELRDFRGELLVGDGSGGGKADG